MKNLIASLAVFRELFDQQKNLYDVMRLFISSLIYEKNMDGFTSVEMAKELKENFEFKIPELVIKTSMKRLNGVKKTFDGRYVIDRNQIDKINTINQLYSETIKKTNAIIINLFSFFQISVSVSPPASSIRIARTRPPVFPSSTHPSFAPERSHSLMNPFCVRITYTICLSCNDLTNSKDGYPRSKMTSFRPGS